ncbi:hypothetical protein ACFXTN_037599 [Malus domestica]
MMRTSETTTNKTSYIQRSGSNTMIHEAERDGKMSNFATTEHHHHGSHNYRRGSEEWASSMAVSLLRAGSSCSNNPGDGPSNPCHKAAEPGSSRVGPSCCLSSVGPRSIINLSCANNPFGLSRSPNSADLTLYQRRTAPTHVTHSLAHFRSSTCFRGPLGNPDWSKTSSTISVLDF